MKAKGIEKPIVASLAGDVEVEEAADISIRAAFRPMPTPPNSPSRSSAPSPNGRAERGLL